MRAKYVNEEHLFTHLKPKTPEELKKAEELKQYYIDVLQHMIDTGYPRHISHVQIAFNHDKKKLIDDNFEKGILAKATADTILCKILDS